MIKTRNLIILGVVLVLLVGAAVGVHFLLKEEESPAVDLNNLSSSSVEIFKVDEDAVSEIHAEVGGEIFSFVRSGEEWQLNGFPDVKLKSSSVDSLLSNLATVTGEKKITDSADDISIYGLNEPLASYTLMLNDGGQKTLLLGNQDPVSKSYYFNVKGETAVYTVYSTRGDSLLRELSYYRDDTLLRVNTTSLNYISIHSGGSTIELELRTSGEGENQTSDWWMTKPRQKKTDAQRVSENILTKLESWTIQEFVYDGTENDAQYGLSSPVGIILLKDSAGTAQTFEIGNKTDDNRYIRVSGSDGVYTVSADAVEFFNVDPFLLIEKFVNLENIDNVNSIEVKNAQGAAHTLSILRDGENESYQLDGNDTEEKKFKTMYQSVIGLTADGFSQNPQKGAALYTVVYHLTDGSSKTYEYCEYDDRNYAVFGSDGSREYFIRKKKLEDMFTAMETPA